MVNMKVLMLLCATATEASESDREEEPETTDKGGKFKHSAYGRPDFTKE